MKKKIVGFTNMMKMLFKIKDMMNLKKDSIRISKILIRNISKRK